MDFRIVALFLKLVAVRLVNGNPLFTYTVINVLKEPFLNETIQLQIFVGRNLNTYMEDACKWSPGRFTTFTVIFQPAVGLVIKTINGVPEYWKIQTYWQISNATGLLGVDVSNYIPEANDKIVFELIQVLES